MTALFKKQLTFHEGTLGFLFAFVKVFVFFGCLLGRGPSVSYLSFLNQPIVVRIGRFVIELSRMRALKFLFQRNALQAGVSRPKAIRKKFLLRLRM